MVRYIAAAIITVCLSPAWLSAQTVVFTVNVTSAEVHKSPSTGSPIIGHSPRGSALEVTRNLGSWVKVDWPGAQDGIGYVHMSRGSLSGELLPDTRPTVVTSVRSAAEPAAPATSTTDARLANPAYVTPATHLFGLGGRISGSTLGFGGTARVWRRNRLGAELEVSRYALSSDAAQTRVTAIQFEPSLLYSLPDRMTDYIWVRPYLGAGVNLGRRTSTNGTPGAALSVSENIVGFQVFGGGEVSLAVMPQFALGIDLGYQSAKASPVGLDLGGARVSVSGHWYVR
jgi:hypothetical protein